MKRACKYCKTEIEVKSKCATVVICDSCRVEKGFPPSEKRDYDTDDFVYCRKCNVARRRLDLHIKRTHKITVDEYLKEFLDAPIYADNTKENKKHSGETKEKMSKSALETWKDDEIKEKRINGMIENNYWKGKKQPTEFVLKRTRNHDYRHSVKGYRKDIGISVRGLHEANFCRILQYNNIQFKYEEPFVLKDGRLMLIDFYLLDDFEMFRKNKYVEFKGWKDKNGFYSNKPKFDYLEKHHNNIYKKIKFVFADSPEWKYLENKYKDKIPLWEISGKFTLYTHPEIFGRDQINKKEEWDEFVICPLCFKNGEGIIRSRCRNITYKHITKHGYTVEQFRNEFPDQKMKIDSIGKEHSKKISGEKHFNYGKKLAEETRQKISNSVEETWNNSHETKICKKCGKRMHKYNENDICARCREIKFADKDTDNYVYCRICKLANQNLTIHINNEHNMTTEEYKKKYNAPITCKSLRQSISEGHLKTHSL